MVIGRTTRIFAINTNRARDIQADVLFDEIQRPGVRSLRLAAVIGLPRACARIGRESPTIFVRDRPSNIPALPPKWRLVTRILGLGHL